MTSPMHSPYSTRNPSFSFLIPRFAHDLINNLLHNSTEIVCRTLDFLNNCCHSQKNIFNKLIFIEDNNTSKHEGLLLASIQKLITRLNSKKDTSCQYILAELRTIRQKLCCLIYQILSNESLPKKTLIFFWESAFVHAIKSVIEDFCTESSGFLNSISEFMNEIQVKVKNDFSFQK
jgi:hypothetical protein